MARNTQIFDVIPAIDLRGGRCVRLYQGDYARETVFSDDPAAMAAAWEKQGAKRLHIVDLDGAAAGVVCHWDVISDITRKVHIPVQVGGGVRDMGTAEKLLSIGVKRVILGTVAVEDPELVAEACNRLGDAVVVSVDARDGYASTRGWKKPTRVKAVDLAELMEKAGARRIIYTDIASDGTLGQPNFKGIEEMLSRVSLPVLAAGGISSVEHVRKLKEIGVEGAILGRALYTGAIDLNEALLVSKMGQTSC
ncbi:MAG: 1-(5-phosphoribosyl)-5-[(5-phosphoribosylamino)methylideneamino]imidazole-4-carboxamide isomerase [Dehalococcoidia bacterium]|nr:1-(5-phosphoribosyl)-5-[(5-phosphoribosylamino)methylideneamino]imidazole-4-carboxamide isomerase [Dehalococcoidia bacterium]